MRPGRRAQNSAYHAARKAATLRKEAARRKDGCGKERAALARKYATIRHRMREAA